MKTSFSPSNTDLEKQPLTKKTETTNNSFISGCSCTHAALFGTLILFWNFSNSSIQDAIDNNSKCDIVFVRTLNILNISLSSLFFIGNILDICIIHHENSSKCRKIEGWTFMALSTVAVVSSVFFMAIEENTCNLLN